MHDTTVKGKDEYLVVESILSHTVRVIELDTNKQMIHTAPQRLCVLLATGLLSKVDFNSNGTRWGKRNMRGREIERTSWQWNRTTTR